MFGSGLGFVLNQPNLSSGAGGGGGQVLIPDDPEFVQTAAFTAGSLILTLPNAPYDPKCFQLFYNGVLVRPGATGYTLSGTSVTINFGDNPADYDDAEVFFAAHYFYV